MSWCDCSSDDVNPAQFYSDTIPTARKDHKCCECSGVIAKGESYEFVTGKWDGEFCSFRTCLKCVDIRKHFCPNGWEHGGLDEILTEVINTNLATIREFWLMPGPERTIAGLVDLVCELLESKADGETGEG